MQHRPSLKIRDLGGTRAFWIFPESVGRLTAQLTFLEMSLQEMGTQKVIPWCLGESIQSCSFAALGFCVLPRGICGSLYTTWVCSVGKELPSFPEFPPRSHSQAARPGLYLVGINFLPIKMGCVWPRAPFSQSLKFYVYFMGYFTCLFLIHFQLKVQNTGFVRALWWFWLLLVHLFFPPKRLLKFNKCCSDICMLNC